MKYKHLLTLLIAFSFLLTTSCNSKPAENTITITKEETTDFSKLVEDWSKAHTSKDVGAFSNLYNNSILFYGTLQTKNECIESKLSLFKKYPNFKQTISSHIVTENINETEVTCSFTKSVTINDKTTDYPSYLTFQNVGNEWKIIVESDEVTDENLTQKAVQNEKIIQKEYSYYPTIEELSGTLTLETFYGRPNYGQTPETDEKLKYYILVLDSPIDVIAESEEFEEGNYDSTKRNIKKIQLSLPDGTKIKNYLNKNIKLNGTFFGAHSGYHNTEVIMEVENILK